ncbi:hypothetical protein [Austwickia chelonae]|uniref:hypothetical protein n=1 Tax=Austwickia chelonae TaxID=100225 RepID=UPI000E281C19|nr:hypothetical protein [Austwickia chelonae]
MYNDRSGIGPGGAKTITKSVSVAMICLSMLSLSACGGDAKEGGSAGSSENTPPAPAVSAHPVSKVEEGVKDAVAKLGAKPAQADDVEALMKLACVVKQSEVKDDAMAEQIRTEAKERKVPQAAQKPEVVVAAAKQHLCP